VRRDDTLWCHKIYLLRKSTIENHISGESNEKNILKRDRSQVTLLDYRRLAVTNEREVCAAGSTLPLDVNAYMMTVKHALLKTGTPFTVLDKDSEIRDLFATLRALSKHVAT
jgi:hypothetical protein